MVRRGWGYVLFVAAMLTAQSAGAQPAGGVRDAHGVAPQERVAPAPGDRAVDELLALDPGAAGPADPAGPGGARRMGRGAGPRGGPGMGRPFAGMAAELKLTEQQRAKLADVRERQLRKGIQARADLALQRLDLRRLMSAETPSATAIDAQIDRIARTRAELAKSRVASLLEMRGLLTPEQRTLLRERREERGGRLRAHGFGGDGRGRGPDGEGETE